MPGILHIDFGILAGEARIWFDDEALAHSTSRAFGGQACVLQAVKSIESHCDHVVSGRLSTGYSIDGATELCGTAAARAVVIPCRGAGERSNLERVSVASWPGALMPSLDAPLARDALFRSLVHLFAAREIPVLRLRYDEPADGVELVREVTRSL